MSNQLQIESYRISMRKLRTFYGKVTEFLNDDKMPCLQGLDVIVKIELYWHIGQTVYLYNKTGFLCKSLSECGMHISSTELSDFSQKNKHQPLQSIIIPQKMRKKLYILI